MVQRLIEACKGDERPDFPVLDELSGGNIRQDEPPRTSANVEGAQARRRCSRLVGTEV